jgi:1,5-anhydro-D-fructose reductase (1,5-anhydro-D-mannitol-forming)
MSPRFDLPNPPHILRPLVQSIVDQLHGRGTCPSTGTSALRTARVIDQVLWADYGGRAQNF